MQTLRRLRLVATLVLKQAFRSRKRHAEPNEDRETMLFLLWFVGVPILALVVGNAAYLFFKSIADIGGALGQRELALVLSLNTNMLFLFVTGVFLVFARLQNNRDTASLVPLPLRTGEIIVASLIPLLLTQYLTCAVFFIPALLAFGSSGIPLFYLRALMVFVLIPFLPLSLAGIVAQGVQMLVPKKFLKAFAYIGGLIGVLINFGIHFYLRSGATSQLTTFLQSQPDIVARAGSTFAPSIWASRALAQGDSLWMAAYIGVSACGAIALFQLSNYSIMTRLDHVETSPRARARKVTFESRSLLSALVFKEWRILLRDPAAMNLVFRSMVASLFIILPSLTNREASIGTLAKLPNGLMLVSALITLMLAFSCQNMIASTAVSREGRSFYIVKTSPITGRTYITAKLFHALSTSAGIALLLSIAFALVFHIPAFYAISSYICGVLCICYLTAAHIREDLYEPNLTWNTNAEMYRRSFIPLLKILLVIGAVGLIGYPLARSGQHMIAIALVGIILGALAYREAWMLLHEADTNFGAIEA